MNNGLTVTCISANKKQTTFASFTKFGNKYWTDCAGNKSKPGYYFAFYDTEASASCTPCITHSLASYLMIVRASPV